MKKNKNKNKNKINIRDNISYGNPIVSILPLNMHAILLNSRDSLSIGAILSFLSITGAVGCCGCVCVYVCMSAPFSFVIVVTVAGTTPVKSLNPTPVEPNLNPDTGVPAGAPILSISCDVNAPQPLLNLFSLNTYSLISNLRNPTPVGINLSLLSITGAEKSGEPDFWKPKIQKQNKQTI